MHGLDVDGAVGASFQRRADVGDMRHRARKLLPDGGRCSPNLASSQEFAPVETRHSSCDDGPRVRVGGRFASDIAGIELRDGGVEVVEVERDERRDPVVGVDLDYLQEIRLNASGTRRCASIGHE